MQFYLAVFPAEKQMQLKKASPMLYSLKEFYRMKRECSQYVVFFSKTSLGPGVIHALR